MKNTNNQPIETLKKTIDSASQRSKESIKALIDTNSKQFESALEANKKTFDSVSKMLYDKEMDPSIISSFKSNFGKSIKLTEDVIGSIIDANIKRLDLSIDFTTRFMDIIKNEDINSKKGLEKLMDLVRENLEETTELSMHNMKSMVSIYNEQLNLTLNFNKVFADNIDSQISSMFKIHKKNLDGFPGFNMITEWWKNSEEKAKT